MIKEYAEKYKVRYVEGRRPWSIRCDLAFPSATQNEISEEDGIELVKNGCYLISEGANMPSTPEAIEIFLIARILSGPDKAANAGRVTTSGIEMTQNSMCLPWTREKVGGRLQMIITGIHNTCSIEGKSRDISIMPIAQISMASLKRQMPR
jgi:glutamate dehydrogenase/leucine dehydrogenase